MKTLTVVGIVLVLLLMGVGGSWYAFGKSPQRTVPSGQGSGRSGADGSAGPVPVTAITVGQKDVNVYLDGLGTLQGFQTVTVRPQIDGELIRVGFVEGQTVNKGDVLAEIDHRSYQAQLDQSKAKLEQDKTKVLQDQAKVNQDRAKKNQDQAKQRQDEAKKAQDEAVVVNSRLNMSRNQDAYKAGAVSLQTVTDLESVVTQGEAVVRGDDSAIQSDQAAIVSDDAAIEADFAQLKNDEALIKADEAAIKYQETLLSYTTIQAPIDGRVGFRQVDVGNIVHPSDPNGLVTLTQISPISMVFTLPQQELARVNQRMAESTLTVQAVEADGKTEIEKGKLELVDNQIDPATGTIKLKATFKNEKQRLWPGGFANARLLLEVHKDAIVIPGQAVQQGADGPFVYAITADQTLELRNIKIGMTQDGESVIQSGLEVGEQIVLSGQDRLKPGVKVTIVKPRDKNAEGSGPDGKTGSKGSNRKKNPGEAGPEKTDGAESPAGSNHKRKKPDGASAEPKSGN